MIREQREREQERAVPVRAPAGLQPAGAAQIAQLQGAVGNRAVASMLGRAVQRRVLQRFTDAEVAVRMAALPPATRMEAKAELRAAEIHAAAGGGAQTPAQVQADLAQARREVNLAWEFHQLALAGKVISPDMDALMQAGLTAEERVAAAAAAATQFHRRHDYSVTEALDGVDLAATQAALDLRGAANPLTQTLPAGQATLAVAQMATMKQAFYALLVPVGPAITANQKTRMFGNYALGPGLHQVTMRQPAAGGAPAMELTYWVAVAPHGTAAAAVVPTARAASQATLANVTALNDVNQVTTAPFRSAHSVDPGQFNDAGAVIRSFERHRANTRIRWDAATHDKILLEVKSRTLAHEYRSNQHYVTRDFFPMIDIDAVAQEAVSFDARFSYGVLHNANTGAWSIYHLDATVGQTNRRVLAASNALKVGLRNMLL